LACLIVEEEEEEGNEWLAKDVVNAVLAMDDNPNASRASNTKVYGPSPFQLARSTDCERKAKKRKKEEC
jgi:hypothetical protein